MNAVLKYLPYVRKNILGHRVRSAMTVAGTALLMFLFLFVSSIQEGLDRLLDSRDDRLIVYQAYRLCPPSSQLPVFYDEAIRDVPGVKDVLPVKVVVSNCRASLDTVVFQGVDPNRQFLVDSNAVHNRLGDHELGVHLAARHDLDNRSPFRNVPAQFHVLGHDRAVERGQNLGAGDPFVSFFHHGFELGQARP